MWPFKSNKVDSNTSEAIPISEVASDRAITGIRDKSDSFKGFTAPPPASVSSFSVLPITTSRLSQNDDAYDRELSTFSDPTPDTPAIQSSGVDRFLSGSWIENPRARACYANVKLGVKMGGLVGGIFGALAGTVYAVQARQILVLPATMIICKC